jgi:anaerobic magnesium-protoporphyrin IX monomethyl ester cyclase
VRILFVRPSDLPNEDLFKKDVAGLYPPLGLLYLAAVVEELGVVVELCDELVGDDYRPMIDSLQPGDLVGVTVTSPLVKRTAEILQYARRRGCQTVIGGPHVSALPAESLGDTGADAAVIGEGEHTLAEFVQTGSWESVAGAVWLDEGEARFNPARPTLEDLDTLPFPARHLLRWEHYRGTCEFGFVVDPREPWTTLVGSRGCAFDCKFCGSSAVFGRRVRTRSVENILAEITEVSRRWGVKNFTFSDDNFVFSESRTQEFCTALRDRGLRIRWSCLTRVNLSTETLQMMKDAGCVLIGFGVESGSPEVLRRINKRIDLHDVESIFARAREVGIQTKSFFMIGLPGEGRREFELSVRLAIRIRPSYLWLSILVPLPGTEVYAESHTTDGSYLYSEDPVLSRRYKEFIRRFYLRPRYLLELATHPSSAAYYLGMFKAYVRFVLEGR